MDPELLRQRQAFLKRAAATPTITQKPSTSSDAKRKADDEKNNKSAPKRPRVTAATLKSSFDYKQMGGSSMSANFGILAKIVDHLKKRHLDQKTWGLSFQEILEEIQLFDVNKRSQQWLQNEGMPPNPRITTDPEGKFIYKPPYRIKGKNSLLNVLKKHDLEAKGGILVSDVADCVANPEKIVQGLGDAVIEIPTAVNKRKDKVIFYNDPECSVSIAEDFKGLWRGISVDHLDEKKIEEYLQKHGIDSMKDLAPKKAAAAPKRRTRRKAAIVHNEHLAADLQDYSVQE